MQICQPHWDKIRALVDEHGMAHLVGNVESAHERLASEITGDAPVDDAKNLDPLLRVNAMIWERGLSMGGLYMMNGDICPICEAMKHMAHVPLEGKTEPVGEAWVEKHWTEGPVLAVKGLAITLGALPPVQ